MTKQEHIDAMANLITEEQRIILSQASHRSVRRFHRATVVYTNTYNQVLDEVFARQVRASRRQVAFDRTMRKAFGDDAKVVPLTQPRVH